ncbi:MAG: NACHT domain-containing protein, partial [Cyanobacteria bacterium J06555_13]
VQAGSPLASAAESLLERIGDELSQPIPVILNLSSWAKKRKPISEWLVQELYETFQVSKALGKAWIKDEQLVLCLDGLDEVAEKHRNACVEALNQFIQDHGRTEMVVCSRRKDYEALSEQLRLRSAIYVQPLTPQQVDQYLEQVGEQLTVLRTVLNQNTEIKAFAASPLILSIMSLVYQGCSLEQFPQLIKAESFRQQLFRAYVKRMFQRRDSTPNQYSNAQTTHWLIWMAQRMVPTSQTVFLIERIQPSWLQSRGQRLQYRLESSLIVGLPFWLLFWLTIELTDGLINGLFVGLLLGLIFGIITAIQGAIQPVETLKWSWKAAKKAIFNGFIYGLLFGLLFGLSLGLFGGLVSGLSYGLLYGLLFGLIGGLIGGLRGSGIQKRTKPNQGMWKSAHNALIGGLFLGLIGGLIGGLAYGLLGGLIGGLIGGGLASLRHFSLRFMLYCMGHAPWNYARFLDYATERLFLQKVGGGYIFIHRMLLEHFAQMELAPKCPK